jgi:hypothetical protein
MKMNRPNKLLLSPSKTPPRSASSDFSSILDESPWERFVDKVKPLMKALLALVVIGGAIYGGVLLFGGNNTKRSSEVMNDGVSVRDNSSLKLAQCVDDIAKASPSPETSDPEFYAKLIGRYDKQLGCYEQYPNTDLTSRSRLEELRKSAIDSSGAYKDTYLAGSGTYNYTSSNNHTNTTTGCSYTLSEREYIKCTDDYNSKNGTSVSRTPPPITASPTPTSPEPSTPSTPTSTSPSTPTSGVDYTALNECLEKANSYPNEASKARARQYCYQTWGG